MCARLFPGVGLSTSGCSVSTFFFVSPLGTAPWGKRGWKMFHTLLRGMVLYFLKVGRQSNSVDY